MLSHIINFNFIEKIGTFLFILFVLSILIDVLKYRKTLSDLNKGKNSVLIEEFPVHITSNNAYLKSNKKVEDFIDCLLKDQRGELRLNSDDLNNLYTKGSTLNKYIPGRYLYYEIKDNTILQKLIEGPTVLSSKSYTTATKEVYYSNTTTLKEYAAIKEQNGRKINYQSKKGYPISISSLLLFIFGGSNCPSKLSLGFKKTIEYKRSLLFLKKISYIDISCGHLIIKT